MSTLDLNFNQSVRDADAYVAPGGRYVYLAPNSAVTRVSVAAVNTNTVVVLPPTPTTGTGLGVGTDTVIDVSRPERPPIFTGDLNYGQLIGTPLQTVQLTGAKWSILDTPNDLNFQVTREDDQAGALYKVELKISISGLSAQRTDQLHRLTETLLTAMFADSNGRYHLLGYPEPLRATGFQFGTGNENGYTLTLTGKQTVPPLEISRSVITSALYHPFIGGDTFAGGPQTSFIPPSGGGSGSNSYGPLRVVTPPNNGFIEAADNVAIVQAGYKVYLNQTPTMGEFHIIKAKPGATILPVTVVGAPFSIDGHPEFTIDSGTGSVTIIFSGSVWEVTAFADE